MDYNQASKVHLSGKPSSTSVPKSHTRTGVQLSSSTMKKKTPPSEMPPLKLKPKKA